MSQFQENCRKDGRKNKRTEEKTLIHMMPPDMAWGSTIGKLKKKTEFQNPETNKKCIAKLKNLTKIYKVKNSSILKETKFDYMTFHPNNFQKQKCILLLLYSMKEQL